MVSVTSLWLPILVSAVLVFVVSSLVHMVLAYHRGDLRKVPREDDVMNALRPFNIPPGDYMMPKPSSMADMKNPAFIEKRTKGPTALMTILPAGPMTMGPQLAQWFLYSIVVSIFAGYIAGSAVGEGGDSMEVCRFAGTVAFAGYGLALPQFSIWYKRNWGTTIKSLVDSALYAAATSLAFVWLWPK
jgi:hypothetical protein